MSRFTQVLFLAAAATSAVARSPTPRFPYDDNTSSYCTWWLNYEGNESCDDILDTNWITIEEFRRWVGINPHFHLLETTLEY